MLEKAINKILSLAEPHVLEIYDENYTDKKLTRVPYELRAEPINFRTLTGLLNYIAYMDADRKGGHPYFVQVQDETTVRLVSGLDGDREREILATATAEIPRIPFESFIDTERLVIVLQSMFTDDWDTDRAALLKFAGTVKSESVTEYGDDGVSQKATIKCGVASVTEAVVPSPCKLRPYRNFLEVEQPLSRFIFRMRNEGQLVTAALIEADGGAWRNEARQSIKEYLDAELDSRGIHDILVLA